MASLRDGHNLELEEFNEAVETHLVPTPAQLPPSAGNVTQPDLTQNGYIPLGVLITIPITIRL